MGDLSLAIAELASKPTSEITGHLRASTEPIMSIDHQITLSGELEQKSKGKCRIEIKNYQQDNQNYHSIWPKG